MPRYTLETQRGKRLTIESDSPENAMRLADRWDLEDHASGEAQRMGVSPDLILRQMNHESGVRADAVSPKGARGPMQLMPGTAKELGVDPDDPYQNITGGVTYFKRQLDAHNGDERLALAAYNAGPGAVQKYGGVPPYAETRGYVNALAGQGGGSPAPAAPTLAAAPERPPQRAPQAPLATPDARPTSQGLGFKTELARIAERLAPYSPANLIPGFREANEAAMPRLQQSLDTQAQTSRPGKIGAFGADMVAGLGVSGPLSPLLGGAVSGAALGNSEDLPGVLKDAVIGGAAGRLAAGASDAVQLGARKLLSKAPQIMTLPQLEAAKKAAYAAVDNAGFSFPKADIAAMADDFAKTVGSSALSKGAKDDAQSIIAYTRQLAKGDLPIGQLEKLHGDIYTAMVKKGGDVGVLGGQFRDRITSLIDSADDGLVRTARDLNTRYKKADVATRASQSADIRAEKDYGGDYGRKLKDRLFPLIDPASPTRNLRGATPDERAAIEKIVRGTKGQNAASTVGGMLDPRRLGGKILSGLTTTGGGAGAPFSGGLSLLIPATQMGAGFALTGAASKAARQNLDELVRLIAAGGSKEALKKVPTRASYAAERAVASARPVAAASAPALLIPQRKKKAAR